MTPLDRLAFSTLGCPAAPIADVIEIARAAGAHAIELRCLPGEPVSAVTGRAELALIREHLAEAGIAVACLATYVEVGAPEDPRDQLLQHVQVARELDAPFIRVFGSAETDEGTLDRAVAVLRYAAAAIEGAGVTVLLETHDSFPTGAAAADLLSRVDSPSVGVIWDVVNPWRHGENPTETIGHLLPWLRHVQLKDIAAPELLEPVLPGEGAVPLHSILDLLDAAHYEGWLCLEWEKAWHPGIPSVEIALQHLSRLITAPRRSAGRP